MYLWLSFLVWHKILHIMEEKMRWYSKISIRWVKNEWNIIRKYKKKRVISVSSNEKNCSTYMKYYQGSNMSHRFKLPESVEKKTYPGGSGCMGLTAWLWLSRTVYQLISTTLSNQSPGHFLCQSVSQPASYNFKGGPKDLLFTKKVWKNSLMV